MYRHFNVFFFYPAETQWTFNQSQKALMHARDSVALWDIEEFLEGRFIDQLVPETNYFFMNGSD